MIVADMVLDLRQQQVEVWTHEKTDGPAFSGTLVQIVVMPGGGEEVPGPESHVAYLGLLDSQGLSIRVPAYAISAVVSRAGR